MRSTYLPIRLIVCWLWVGANSAQAAPHDPVVDVVIYGGSSAAVTAAVEVARLGKSVVIVSPDTHLGGMTTHGLGWTDIGSRDAIGGLAREFYSRIYQHYQSPAAWINETREQYIARSSLDPDEARQMMFTFEPKVAQRVLDDLIAEAKVQVVFDRLDRKQSVVKTGTRITSIRTLTGQKFAGRVFIDASYEGDLLAAAGVAYTVGREWRSMYNERLAGIQTALATKNQLPRDVDPYLIPGVAGSGLLPGINPTAGGADGDADTRLQAYTFRMVLTDDPANRVAIARPPDYNPDDFELLLRAIEAGQAGQFFKLSPMPNRKTDSNNEGGISTDCIGCNYDLAEGVNWAESDYPDRAKMLKAHRDYQLGLVWTLQNSERVPPAIRKQWSEWGLAADEFADDDNWPPQLYVREGRRMLGQLVLQQQHVDQQAGFEVYDSIGVGGYNMDSHHVQRYVDASGHVRNEGDIQAAPARGPYGISYRAIVPKPGEADNLLVPVAVSASHVAYGSIRMEPVFMTLGQAAGAAAAIAIDDNIAVQRVPYNRLEAQLVRDGVVLRMSKK